MPLPQNGVENRVDVVLILQTVPQFAAEVETQHQSRPVPQLKLLLSHHLPVAPEGHKLLICQVPDLGCSGKCYLHTIHAHSSDHTDSSRGWRGLAESAPDEETKPCNRHRDLSSTSPSQFPYLQGEIIFLLWEHVHYRHGFQKRQ